MNTSWSRFCSVNHQALAGNYQLSNIKCLSRDLNRRPQRLKASILTATPLSPVNNPRVARDEGERYFEFLVRVPDPAPRDHYI